MNRLFKEYEIGDFFDEMFWRRESCVPIINVSAPLL